MKEAAPSNAPRTAARGMRLADLIAAQNEARWEMRFGQLLTYQQHGDCQVPARWKENLMLAHWVSSQRKHHRRGCLRQDRRERLEQIGFAWQSDKIWHTTGWEGRYAELVAFKAKHGHLRVTLKNQTSPGFMHWRDNQRINFHEGRLSSERKARLDALGFEWQAPGRTNAPMADQNEDLWEKRFGQLVAFEHGHTQVPSKWQVNPALGKWASLQRKLHKSGQLRQNRAERLEQIGFAWKSDKTRAQKVQGA